MVMEISKRKNWQGKGVIFNGDCLELMAKLPDKSVNMILCDLPYGTTACKWDTIIPFDKLWEQYNRIIKDNGAIVLTAQNPFAANLIISNLKMFRHEWVWQKNAGSNFGCVKFQPMREHENVLVFGKNKVNYSPIMEERTESGKSRVKTIINYNTKTENYQNSLHNQLSSIRPELRYPSSVQKFNRERGLHPTQKPVALFEYLIKTYTNENMLVLDNCGGSGTTAIACINTNRRFVLMEKEEKYYQVSVDRIEERLK